MIRMKLVRCIFFSIKQVYKIFPSEKKCTKYCQKKGMKLVLRCIFLVLNKRTKYFLKKTVKIIVKKNPKKKSIK